MPLYYFHIHGPESTIRDEEGSTLPDLEGARMEAVAAVREMMAESARRGRGADGRELWIMDRNDKLLMALPFDDVVPR